VSRLVQCFVVFVSLNLGCSRRLAQTRKTLAVGLESRSFVDEGDKTGSCSKKRLREHFAALSCLSDAETKLLA